MLQEHIDTLSVSRINTYLQHFYFNNPNNLPEAIALYTAIQHRSGIFFSIIQEIEVALRNAMATCLRQHAPNQDLCAYFRFLATDSTSPLSQQAKRLLKAAINTKKTAPNENDMIANITFGFWVNLLSPQNSALHPIFKELFPNQFPNLQTLFFQLKQVYTFRNDLYHQDKAWNKKRVKKAQHILKDYERTYQNFETILQKIAPARLHLRNKAALNNHFKQLNFDLSLFASEITWLTQHI